MSLSWIKLISFPVFILSAVFSTLLIGDANIYKKGARRLLIIEDMLLITASGMTYFYGCENTVDIIKVITPMLVVFPLGLQNAYGRFRAKEILAPTTVMTGNVTQLFIDITHYLKFSNQRGYEHSIKIINGIYVFFIFFNWLHK